MVKNKDPKRSTIINAATRMFLAHGYRNTSMDKIAQAAPVSKATLYSHFGGKDVLLAAVINELCDAFIQAMTQATIESDDVKTTLQKIAASFVDLIFTEEAIALYSLVIAESRDFPELGRLVYQSGPLIVLNQLQDYLHGLNAKGPINIADPAFAADMFFSLLKGDRHFQCLLGIKPLPTPEEKNQLIAQVLPFYIRGLFHG